MVAELVLSLAHSFQLRVGATGAVIEAGTSRETRAWVFQQHLHGSYQISQGIPPGDKAGTCTIPSHHPGVVTLSCVIPSHPSESEPGT